MLSSSTKLTASGNIYHMDLNPDYWPDLIDTILSIHTVTLSSASLKTCLSQLKMYLQRFRTRLTARHALHLKQLVLFLVELLKYCQEYLSSGSSPKDEVYSP